MNKKMLKVSNLNAMVKGDATFPSERKSYFKNYVPTYCDCGSLIKYKDNNSICSKCNKTSWVKIKKGV